MRPRILAPACTLGAALLVTLPTCRRGQPPIDEATAAGLTRADFPQTADWFRDLDSGIELAPAEVRGRSTWLLWTAGN